MTEVLYEKLFIYFILGTISDIYILAFVDNSCLLFYLITLALSLIATVFSFIKVKKYTKTQIVKIVLTYKRFIAV